ncbi:MAG: DNA repair protein RecN [Clostridia bacterium]|nr:DNA repair protein RecN [Clostridia bacterium]
MLSSLHIENIAVIKTVDIDFSNGFSTFTGETGAGKSILIDSINLLLGNRADKELIRKGETRGFVSAVFEELTESTKEALAALGVETDEEGRLLVQRAVTADGHSAVRLNGRAITLSVLREVGALLLHIHGQNDNRLLTEPKSHIRILDAYADNEKVRIQYAETYRALLDVRRRIEEITVDESERLRLAEMLRYQVADIDAYALKEGEEEILEEKRTRLQNAEKISKQTSFAYRALKGSEKGSVVYVLSRAIQSLEQLRDVLPPTAEMAQKLEDFMWQIDDIAEQVSDLSGEESGDPTTLLNKVEERLDAINKLCRKYGKDISAILAFRDQAANRLATLEEADERLSTLQKEEALCLAEAAKAAETLHKTRVEAASRLEKEITEALSFLDMPRVHFVIRVQSKTEKGEKIFDRFGNDDVEFLISTNAGEAPAPMVKIASGGELSRIMLSIKSVITDKDGIPTVIYDEVDTGVSGKTARKIGIKLLEAAGRTQVLCVTHSAQIASLADHHFVIQKQEVDGRASTSVSLLDKEERINEIARILGGLSVTEAQRQAALDMLEGK